MSLDLYILFRFNRGCWRVLYSSLLINKKRQSKHTKRLGKPNINLRTEFLASTGKYDEEYLPSISTALRKVSMISRFPLDINARVCPELFLKTNIRFDQGPLLRIIRHFIYNRLTHNRQLERYIINCISQKR